MGGLPALAWRVITGKRSAVDLAREHVERVAERNPALNAIIGFDADAVLAEAGAVDQRLADLRASGLGHDLIAEAMPLAGLPFTVKDNVWVGGRRISQGSKLFEDFIAPRDAWVVARLRALGGVVLGITNCSEFACKGHTSNLLHGPTRHPLDPTLTPGGSSGGAVSALAAGLGVFAIGTDAGGSTRRPAAHCGLVGFKPGPGLIPHPWGFAEANFGLSVIGLITTTVTDASWLFDRLIAYDANDPAGVPVACGLGPADAPPLPDPTAPRPLRIAWSPHLGLDLAVDDDVLAALQARIDALRAAGWRIVDADPVWPAGVREYPLLALQQAGLHALFGARLAHERDRIDPDLVAQIEGGGRVTPAEIARVLRLRDQIALAVARFFEHHDLLLCPTTPVTAWPLTQLGPPMIGGKPAGPRGHAAFTPLFNNAGVPACSVPAGQVRGLPVGLQVVGPRCEDARVLQFSAVVANAG